MASFGNYIKTEREKNTWTQTEFGAKIGINSSAISRIENGTKNISKSKLVILAEVFNVDLQILIDMYYADKFAKEACENNCSENVFVEAANSAKYMRIKEAKQYELKF
ncbi:MAG: helix-turn-helix domain-containing protein [Flavobacteriaceae bacterium]|jgi:transcriptional regulator with XRE-family HTH domain|nr:helix-turn-helix domain-containing protein [Flavobacteriaceae bacterium]